MVRFNDLRKTILAALFLFGLSQTALGAVNTPPNLIVTGDTSLFMCAPTEVCILLHGEDDDDDHLRLSMLDGSGNFPTVLSDSTIDTLHCFTPDTSGTYCFIFELDDDAFMRGVVESDDDVDTICINVTINEAPVTSSPPNQSLFVCDLGPICIPGFTFSDTDNNIASVAVSGGTLSGDSVCFTPVAGTNTITLTVTDSCGAVSTSTTDVNVILNSRPTATSPANNSLFVCDLSPICLPGFTYSDVDNNIASVTVSNGTLSGDSVCFTPVPGFNSITLTVTDSCGLSATSTTEIIVTLNSGPTVSTRADTALFVCDLTPVCLPGFTYSDPDNNVASVVVSNGTLSGDTVCFTPVAGVNAITLTVTDSCGVSSTSTTNVTVTLNSGPSASSPADQNMFVCDLSPVCLRGFVYSDADNNIASVTVSNGTLSGDSVCFTPVAGLNTITLTVTDSCGVSATSTTNVTVTVNSAPTASSPADQNVFVCDLSPICLPGFSYGDIDNNVASVTVSIGTLLGDSVCFTPVSGLNTITLTVTDSCGVSVSSTTNVTVTVNSAPTCTVPADTSLFLCAPTEICVGPFTDTDPDGNLSARTVSFGLLLGDSVCFTPDTAGVYTIEYSCTDSCGATTTASVNISVDMNSPPTASCPPPVSEFLCDPAEICIGPFSSSDPDGNVAATTIDDGGLGGSFDGTTYCFTPGSAGTYSLAYIVTDSCGEADTCMTSVAVDFATPPIMNDTTISTFICALGDVCVPVPPVQGGRPPFSYFVGGLPVTDTACFFVGSDTTLSIPFVVVDSCLHADTAVVTVNVAVNDKPMLTVNGPTDAFLCSGGDTVSVSLSIVDPDDGITCVSTLGTCNLGDSTVSFIADTSGSYCGTVIVTDSCGLADTAGFCVNVTINSPPEPSCPGNLSFFACEGQEICIGPFSCVDPDGNLASSSSNIGTILDGESVCFTPDTSGTYRVIYTCTDSCGVSSSCTTDVIVTINSAPVADSPPNETRAVCDLSQICIPGFIANDIDGNLADVTLSGGTLTASTACFTPIAGVNRLTLIAIDSCGAADTSVTDITVTLTSAPGVTCANDTLIQIESLGQQICLSGFSCSDPDGDVVSTTISHGVLNGNTVCFTADTVGTYTFVYRCEDACGNSDECTTTAIIELPSTGPGIIIETAQDQQSGRFATVDISFNSPAGAGFGRAGTGSFETGGYDFLIKYDKSALLFSGVSAGQFLEACQWEYFTYRVGPFDNCAGCTGDLIRIIAVADQNDGPNHPSCYDPLDVLVSNQLASMRFLVSNDANLDCQLIPIRFKWIDCGDNTLSDKPGDSLYIAKKVFDPLNGSSYREITDIGAGFPSMTGPPPSCDIGVIAYPVRNLEMFNGGIQVACNLTAGNRGDINVNGLADEVADAVMYTQYFVEGLQAFLDHIDQSVAASDVNADGLTLTVADLVYLIRVIVGDAPAIPKYDPNHPAIAELILENGTLSLEPGAGRLGGMFIMLEGDIAAELTSQAAGMQLEYRFDGSHTRLLIYSQEGNSLPDGGPILTFDSDPVRIVSTGLSSANGEIVAARIGNLPESYSLSQNYPNPFNPATTISFALPEKSEWTLEVYNTAGQLVTSWSGISEAGVRQIEWDAQQYASGVYLYRLVAGEFNRTRKMVLLK